MNKTLCKRIVTFIIAFFLCAQVPFCYANLDRNASFGVTTNSSRIAFLQDAEQELSTKILGQWMGSYTATESDGMEYLRNITLSIFDYTSGNIRGVFEYSIPQFRGGLYGSYYFEGTIDVQNRKFQLQGRFMIVDDGYYAHTSYSVYSGEIDVDNGIMSGKFAGNYQFLFEHIKEQNYTILPAQLAGAYVGSHHGSTNGINVLRNSTLVIDSCSNYGLIDGRLIIYPIINATNQINAIYRLSGYINLLTGDIFFSGKEWIQYPDVPGDYSFQTYIGHIEISTGLVYGNNGNGEFSYSRWAIDNDDNPIHLISGFTLGKDNNSFIHTDSETWDGAGFVGSTDYTISDAYFNRLTQNSSKGEKNRIKKDMQEEWGGSCYGIAMSMGLLYEGYINVSDLTNVAGKTNYYSLDYPCNDAKFLNMINYYQLSQGLEHGGKQDAAVSMAHNNGIFSGLVNWINGYDSLPVFLRKMVNYCASDHVELLGYSTSDGGHAVLITGCEFDADSDQYRLQIYDENCINAPDAPGVFSYMTVAKDFSSFSYTDANNEALSEENYASIYFLD